MTDPVRVSVLGATGSIGASALDVIATQAPGAPAFEVVALTANTNAKGLAEAAIAARAEIAVIADHSRYAALKELLAGTGIEAAAGADAIAEAAGRPANVVVAGIVGIAGLPATLAAVRQGASIALANKESMVCAGALLRAEAQAGRGPAPPHRFGAQRDLPGAGPPRAGREADPDGLGRPIPRR